MTHTHNIQHVLNMVDRTEDQMFSNCCETVALSDGYVGVVVGVEIFAVFLRFSVDFSKSICDARSSMYGKWI